MPRIDHVVVLLLENRSFDHMLGYLDHPSPRFPNLTGKEAIGGVEVSPTARYQIDSPDHTHEGVMSQLFGGESFGNDWRLPDGDYPTTNLNTGFIESYRRTCGGDSPRAERIMRCFHPATIPVMATLAKSYAVFTNWYCSVPGETWPNRDFAVAAQSFDQVNQHYWVRPKSSTIFEQLVGAVDDRYEPYGIYHDSIAHTFLYPGLYGRGAFKRMEQFFADVENECLPRLSYIEPDFGLGSNKWYMRRTTEMLGIGDGVGNSQHPGQAPTTAEFVAGEHLVAGIYAALCNTLAKHPGSEADSLFARTLFLITYDEHGGFFDRMPPPRAVPPVPNPKAFKFDLLGPRVPAILVSPWIEPGTVIEGVFDHASIPATVRHLFAPTLAPLTSRDQYAARFDIAAIRPDATLRTNPVEVKALDFKGAVAAMDEHGAPAGAADPYPPSADLRKDWMFAAETANKLLPPLPLTIDAIDAGKDPDAFAASVVNRMHEDRRVSESLAAATSPPRPTPPAPLLDVARLTELPRPTVRSLRVYAFDPSRGSVFDNTMTLHLPYQELAKGPVETGQFVTSRLSVVDYDATIQAYYKHVDLNEPAAMLSNGLAPSESDVRFHQQMVYAVARDTITHFEAALGRSIHWRRRNREPGDPRGWLDGDILTLGLHPHAMQAANAFYSPVAHGILFGYFMADRTRTTRALPGQPIFTCLSHDIIVHELTHAILDGQRAHFLEQTNLDVAAFHEAFADLAALFRHFTHREVLQDTMQRTGGRLYAYQLRPDAPSGKEQPMFGAQIADANPLVGLAHQFGDATGMHGALRFALGAPPTPTAYRSVTEPHHRGSILVAAVFDAYFTIYTRRTAELWAVYRAGGGRDRPIDLPVPLANQLCRVASETAAEFFQLCVRAIDYCPPVDIRFGEFLRALITSEIDRNPRDPDGIREALMQAFRSRGILPDGAVFFSEDALCWSRAERLPRVANLAFDPVQLTAEAKDETAAALNAYFADDRVRIGIGLEVGRDLTVKSFHPVFRTVDGRLQRDLVVEVIQTQLVRCDGDPGSRYPFRAGATLVVSNTGRVRWVVSKPMLATSGEYEDEAHERRARQEAFLSMQGLAGEITANSLMVNFANIHGGL